MEQILAVNKNIQISSHFSTFFDVQYCDYMAKY